MAGGGNGREENYWPGFVDALSNVVLTLIFVLVVFVFALAMLANKTSNAVNAIVQEKLKEELAKAQANAASQSTALEADVKNVEVTAEAKTKESESRGAVAMKQQADDLTLVYPTSVLELDDASLAKLHTQLDALKSRMVNSRVIIQSYPGPESYSLAQRLAYYRAIKTRNLLVKDGYIAADKVESRIMPGTAGETGSVHIILVK